MSKLSDHDLACLLDTGSDVSILTSLVVSLSQIRPEAREQLAANVNSSEITAECLKMFGVSDLAEVVATRKDRFIKKYMSNSSVVCQICVICS